MRNTEYFKNKTVAIVGLARSGLACANLLHELGAKVRVSDTSNNEATRKNAALLCAPIARELGIHTRECIAGSDLVVVSPGVTAAAEPVRWALAQNIPVISEIEVGWMLTPATVVAVTGSSGKTTVTTLIARLIEASGRRAFVCGNIGVPFCQEVSKMREGDFVSLEVSSFQLERIAAFRPKIAVMLNISRNHLDRHADMREYLEAKKRIFMNQRNNDFLLLNERDEVLRALAHEARARVVWFAESEKYNPNQAAVAAVGALLGIDAALCDKVLADFKGLAHRCEFVGTCNGITFINDSKSTLVESTAWALKNISARVILIAGGRHKGVDYPGIIPAARGKVKEMILIGEAKGEIRRSLGDALPLTDAETLEEALAIAFAKACEGEYVLLSPMCSSFDMFRDYEHRGEAFKEAVHRLASRVSTSRASL